VYCTVSRAEAVLQLMPGRMVSLPILQTTMTFTKRTQRVGLP
jgi:hypothetical protein